MNLKKTIFTTLVSLLISVVVYAQTDTYGAFTEKYGSRPHKHNYAKEISFQNEPALVFTSLFVFYKTFISSQDQGTCNFTPSCSVYGLHSVRKKGILVGILNTFDRLSRCHRMSPENYEIDPKTGLLIDEVE